MNNKKDLVGLNKMKMSKILLVLVNAILILLSFFFDMGKALLVMAIATNLVLIWELRKIQPALLMGVFFLTYIVYLVPYYFYDFVISVHTQYYKRELYDEVLRIHLLFLSSFLFFLSSKISAQSFKIKDLLKARENLIVFVFLYLVMLFIIFSIKGTSVIGGDYGTYVDNIGEQGGSIEYFYIFFIAAYFFTRKVILRYALLFLVVYYSYIAITRGYRIQFVQMAILTFVLFFDGKFRTRIVMVYAFLGFVLSEIIGMLKMLGAVNFEDMLTMYENQNKDIIISNQTDVFYSSVVFIGLIKDNLWTLGTRIWSSIGFFWNCLVPSSFVWKEARLPLFAHDFTSLGGGGLVSAYFFVWFGYLGPILIGFALAFIFNKTFLDSDTKVYKIICLIVLSLYPRWFAYDPANFLVRFSIYAYLFFMFLVILHNQMVIDKKGINE